MTARVVAVTALVRDEKGQLVRNLDKDRFTVREDGKRQVIRYFDKDSDLPLTIGLMVDTSSSQYQYFEAERIASLTFLRSMINRPQDRAFVMRFDTDTLMLQRMTSDPEKLESALDKLSMPHPPRQGRLGGTVLYDALSATMQKITSNESGRRAVVVLTDGEDNGSEMDINQTIAFCQFADTSVYTVLYTADDPGPTNFKVYPMTGRAVMDQISRATGGRLFVVSPWMPIEKIFAEIEADLRSQYRLGFTPPPSKPGKYHRLQVEVTGKHYTVNARSGYFSPQH